MPGPHYISPEPDEAQAWFDPKPARFEDFDETTRHNCKSQTGSELILVKPDGLKAQKCQARLEPEI